MRALVTTAPARRPVTHGVWVGAAVLWAVAGVVVLAASGTGIAVGACAYGSVGTAPSIVAFVLWRHVARHTGRQASAVARLLLLAFPVASIVWSVCIMTWVNTT